MENKVINSLGNALAAKSMVTLTFSYQGSGESQGTFSTGKERQDDVRAAISFITSLNEVEPARTGLAGYSAGAAWGLSAAYADSRISALAAISPPLSLFDFTFLSDCLKPKLMLSGSQDEHIPENSFLDFCKMLSEPKEIEIIKGADHLWNGYEDALANRTALFFSNKLK
jgi:uncharacterized protein